MRHNFYRDIHKGIRLLLADLGTAAGNVDFTDEAEVAGFAARCEGAFTFLEHHGEHEDRFIGPLLSRARRDLSEAIVHEHEDQHRTLASLRARVRVLANGAPDPARLGHELVLALSRFTSEFVDHMADEEEVLMPALWGAYSDEELQDAHQRLLQSLPPDEVMTSMRWMVPALNHKERVELFTGLKHGAPPPVFAAVFDLARATLPENELARLEEAFPPSSRHAA